MKQKRSVTMTTFRTLTPVIALALASSIAAAKERGRILDRNGVVLTESKNGKRTFPLKEFSTAHIVGYTATSAPKGGTQLSGRTGIEQLHNASLSAGQDLQLTLDAALHSKIAKVFDPKRKGAVVVVDPNNGEIHALASFPSFDPNDFSPGISAEDFATLKDDERKPLFPRAIGATYPPASTFKTITSLAACKAGIAGGKHDSPPSVTIDGRKFSNWHGSHEGPANAT